MKKLLDYDEEHDIFYYNEGVKSSDSLELGDAFIELSSEGKVVGIEITNASSFLSELTDQKTPEILKNIIDAKLTLKNRKKLAFVIFEFRFGETKEEKQTVNFNLPQETAIA